MQQIDNVASVFDEGYYHNDRLDYSWGRLQKEFRASANVIKERFDPVSLLDVGCAKGFMVKALHEVGVDAWGVDASKYALAAAPPEVQFFLSRGIIQALPFNDMAFDTVLCCDVLEHIPEEDAELACSELMRVTDRRLIINVITLEVPDYDDPTHITIKPRQWWVDKLLSHGGQEVPYDSYGAAVWWFNVRERSIVIQK